MVVQKIIPVGPSHAVFPYLCLKTALNDSGERGKLFKLLVSIQVLTQNLIDTIINVNI